MGEAAIRAARSAGYYNAGTVEFLVESRSPDAYKNDAHTNVGQTNFYFLEMNTRLQVEHPVTEAVTGLDLVKLQIRIAAGEPLPLGQPDVTMRGAALECRIYAEDPENDFFPSPGRITELETPSGPGIRDDSGVYAGWTVPVEYDPLISKLIAFGATRKEAIERMQRALGEYYVGGIKTNLKLFRSILRSPDFLEGRLDTGFLERLPADPLSQPADLDHTRAAALGVALFDSERARSAPQDKPAQPDSEDQWKLNGRRQLLRGLPRLNQ
jgi:acetyl-CoA carboxylase biotin carboxylase subunit